MGNQRTLKIVLDSPSPIVKNMKFTLLKLYNLDSLIEINPNSSYSRIGQNNYLFNIEKWNP